MTIRLNWQEAAEAWSNKFIPELYGMYILVDGTFSKDAPVDDKGRLIVEVQDGR